MKRIYLVMAALAMSLLFPQLSRAQVQKLPLTLEDPHPGDLPIDVCEPGPTTLCLDEGRFTVEVEWQSFSGDRGAGRTGPASSTRSGLFWFSDPGNWDLLVKVLDGCGINEHFWVFSASTNNTEYTLRVSDAVTGTEKTYFNPPGHIAPALMDTRALAVCSPDTPPSTSFVRLDSWSDTRPAAALRRKEQTEPEADPPGLCLSEPKRLCLERSRFQAEVEWRDYRGRTGSGKMVPVGSDTAGLFWFFAPNNWEMLVQVRDGCAMNDRFWVIAAAATDVEYTLRVTDTQTGVVREYFNPLGNAGLAVTDTDAFATCPEEDPEILLFANPTLLPVLGSSQLSILARGDDGHPVGGGQRVRLFADLGSVRPDLVVTDASGEAQAVYTAGDVAGQGSVTAVVEGGDPISVDLTLLDAPRSILLSSEPQTVARGKDAEIRIEVQVANPRGMPIGQVPIVFEVPGGGWSLDPESRRALTDERGLVNQIVTVRASPLDVEAGSFVVRATALGGPVPLVEEVVITVQ